ncbi:type VI secretion system ImpA family N-terminal domain-containing protein [Photorhabdus temperata]|uniref:VasL domain-containing protein n=1 Tax=Photorhabdus temperata TaxID=574560 RepID=UPI0021D516EC|nr:VasL domain-containing protein [Photorhabdus temperata]MCT8349368.1 type VI secretion system ImpA family N-terminal domain-containing protein [Photorhabdus temperata]
MTENTVYTGGDPRTRPEFCALKAEMSKLSHPARPDVDWARVEQLCLTLFRLNGVELQSAAWYTLARAQRAGLAGIHEGLALIEGLVAHQWSQFWPQATQARVKIFAWLVARLQQTLRAYVFAYIDLPLIYRTEKTLEQLCEGLQRLELKHVSQLDSLRVQLHNNARRLESLAQEKGGMPVSVSSAQPGGNAILTPPEPAQPQRIYMVRETAARVQPQVNVVRVLPMPRWKAWHGFVAGVALCVLAVTGVWGVNEMRQAPPLVQALRATTQPLPRTLPPTQLAELRHPDNAALLNQLQDETLAASRERLASLDALPALWRWEYGAQLLHQLQTLWPASQTVQEMEKQWQQQREATALPVPELENYHLAQSRLQRLAARLDGLDERRGRYLTGSELKSMVFGIQQPLMRTPPLEELLRQLAEQQKSGTASPALRQQIDTRFNQLLNRYALLTQSVIH